MKETFSKKQLILIDCILLIPTMIYLAYGFLHAAAAVICDGHLRWQEGACLIRGIYPMDIILGRRPPIEAFANFDNTTTTIPWSYILSLLFYPGWLSWPAARAWALLLFIACTIVSILFLIQCLKRNFDSEPQIILFVLIWLCNFGWGSALGKVNNGMFTCLSLMLVVLLTGYYPRTARNDILIGLLLVVAMLKPQIALLFYIPLLFQKRWRSIFLSGAVILAAWAGAAAILHISPVTILLEQFRVGADLKVTSVYVYYGIFDFLTRFGISTTRIMLLQFALFLPTALILGWRFRKSAVWVQFAIPSVLSLLWCYHHNTDLEIIGIFMICIAMLLQRSTDKRLRVFCLLLLLFNLLPISYAYYDAAPIIPFLQRLIYLSGLIVLLYHHRRLDTMLPKVQ